MCCSGVQQLVAEGGIVEHRDVPEPHDQGHDRERRHHPRHPGQQPARRSGDRRSAGRPTAGMPLIQHGTTANIRSRCCAMWALTKKKCDQSSIGGPRAISRIREPNRNQRICDWVTGRSSAPGRRRLSGPTQSR